MATVRYHSSGALAELGRGFDMVAELLQLESAYPDPPPSNQAGAVGGLRGGAAVLMVAVFEGFIRELLVERVDEVRSRNVRLSALPAEMQVHAVFALLERAMKGPPFQPQVPKAQRLPSILAAGLLVGGDSFNADVFGDTKSNPSPGTVREVFKAVGINNIFDAIRPEYDARTGAPTATRFLEDKLDEIIQRRHVVAHTGSVSNVSRLQLAESRDFLLLLASLMDEALFAHCAAIT